MFSSKGKRVRRFKLVMEYDGLYFHGWQVQPGLRTIQGELEKALSLLAAFPVSVHGSGRTDTGVHALAQVAHFDMQSRLNAPEIKRALNSLLPEGVVILNCMEVGFAFHARFSAKAKTYKYRILNSSLRPVLGKNYLWHVWRNLDRRAMELAASFLVGTYDFTSFEGAGSPRKHNIRTLFRAEFKGEKESRDVLVFEVTADGFLRYMVRNIVGTLVNVGLGKIRAEDIESIIKAKDRRLAGVTAPPQGLFLKAVHYDSFDDFKKPAMETRKPPCIGID